MTLQELDEALFALAPYLFKDGEWVPGRVSVLQHVGQSLFFGEKTADDHVHELLKQAWRDLQEHGRFCPDDK